MTNIETVRSTLETHYECASNCRKCSLGNTTQTHVIGYGLYAKKYVIIAEAPGETEEIAGIPLIGKAGKYLQNSLAALHFNMDKDFYRTNVLYCRPPNNRNPSIVEINSCYNHLIELLNILQPIKILCFGAYSSSVMYKLLNTVEDFSRPYIKFKSTDITSIGKLIAQQKTEGVNFSYSTKEFSSEVYFNYHPSGVLRKPEEHEKTFKETLEWSLLTKKNP